jgi:hypothetical protein
VEKFTTYWRVRSADDPSDPPVWSQLDEPPGSTDGMHGELDVENDDQRMLVYFADAAAHERVVRVSRDAAALVQEHEIPHQPLRPDA